MTHFLDGPQSEVYRKTNGGLGRSVVEIPIRPVQKTFGKSQPLVSHLLEPYIVEQVSNLIANQEGKSTVNIDRKWFGCACIEVKEDDGMTWSAEAVARALKENYSRFHCNVLASYKAQFSLPVIANLVGMRTFLKMAARHKMGSLFALSSPWVPRIIVGGALLIGGTIKILEGLQKASPTKTTYLLILGSATLGLFSQYLGNHLMPRPAGKKIDTFNAELDRVLKIPELSNDYLGFIESLAECLRGLDFPRFVIIDDYERLDATTKHVISRYLKEYMEGADGSEYWVIFEGQDGDKFSEQVLTQQESSAYRVCRLLRQLFLTEEEKQRLGRPPEALNYQAVKLICTDATRGKERIRKLVTEHRQNHPKSAVYGDLEFLYLLSLTAATPSDFSLSYSDLLADLTSSGQVRADVLKQVLQNTKLAKYEFQSRLATVEKTFPACVNIEESGSDKRLHVSLETTQTLTEFAGALGLPPPDLGHLYWSLYGHDKLKPTPEAYQVRKLNDHLKQAELFNTAGGDISRIASNFFDALVLATNNSLRSGLFTDISELLEKAQYVLQIGGLPSPDAAQKRLSRTCWEAYSVLGHDEILAVALDLRPPAKEPQGDQEDLLEEIFFESVPISPLKRATLAPNFFSTTLASNDSRITSAERQTVESASHYAKARAAWLALSVSPLISDLSSTKLGNALEQSDLILDELGRNALTRIESKASETIRVTDMLTLSLTLWCSALKSKPSVRRLTNPNDLESFRSLIDLATSAVLKAAYIKEESAARSDSLFRMDFLASGLARELYAIAITSVITANQFLVRQRINPIDKEMIKKINDLFSFSNEIFNYPLPRVSAIEDLSSWDLFEKIDAMLTFCSIIWDRFGLQRLVEFINIRKVHFNAVCQGVHYSREESYESLLESMGAAINDRGFTGLIGNLVAADCVQDALEIEAYYLRQAGMIALHGNFGQVLKQELSFAIINQVHHLDYDLDIFLESILRQNKDRKNFLLEALKRLPQDSVSVAIMKLFNAPRKAGSRATNSKLAESVSAFVDHIQWPAVKKDVEELYQYYSFKSKLETKEPIDFDKSLAFWQDRKHSHVYAGILQQLIIHDQSHNVDIWQDGLALLDHDPLEDGVTWCFHLAILLGSHFQDEVQSDAHKRSILLRYLKGGVDKWKSTKSAKSNLQIYRLLQQFDPAARVEYRAEIQKWQYVEMRRQQLERLPQLVEQGQFFLIFDDYVDNMVPWGLELDEEIETHNSNLNLPAHQKKDTLLDWVRSGAIVPTLVKGPLVSSRFLCLGYYLFSEPNSVDTYFDSARSKFNQAASDAMPQLLDLIIDLEALPSSIKDLLQTYSMRFFRTPDPD